LTFFTKRGVRRSLNTNEIPEAVHDPTLIVIGIQRWKA
jgi:hypothetical protein